MSNRRNIVYGLMILSLIASFMHEQTVFLLHVVYVFGLVLLVSLIFSWTSVNWLRINRWTYVRRIQVGDTFDESFHVKNSSLLPKLWLEVRDHSDLPQHASSRVVPVLNGRSQYQWRVQTPCTRRGQFTLGPLTISSGDPFGFYQFNRHINATSHILVYPITIPIYEFASPIGALSGGQAVRRRTYDTTPNVSGVREYAPGDSMNRIHWRTSARRSKLMVKEFELDPLGDVWIFLDMSRESLVAQQSVWGGADYILRPRLKLPPSTEEYTIVIASSLVQYFVDQNRAVGFLSYTPRRDYFSPDRGDRQLINVLETLATAKSKTDMTLQQMLGLEGHNLTRGTTMIIVTSSLQTAWAAEAYSLTQRGVMVVAVMIDPTGFGGQATIDFSLVQRQIESAGIIVYPIQRDDDLTTALSYRPRPIHS